MVKLLVVYVHLLATCTALGTILASDLRLLGRLRDPAFRISVPNHFVTILIAVSLALLCVTGAALVAIGLTERDDYLSNPKLQAKLALVGLLILNAFVLHAMTFPSLARRGLIRPWTLKASLCTAAPIALSNALWLFVAFLGVARPWNYTVSAATILWTAASLTLAMWVAVMATLHLAAHRQRMRRATAKTHGGDALWAQASAGRVARQVVDRARTRSLNGGPQRATRESARTPGQ